MGSGPGAGAEAGQLSRMQEQGQTKAQATPAIASSTLATLASDWVLPFGRQKRVETGVGGAAAWVRGGDAEWARVVS